MKLPLSWPRGDDFRRQLVTAAAIVGVPVCWATAAANAAAGSNLATVLLNVAAGFVTIGLLWFARATGRYRLTYLAMVIGLFGLAFPWFFFAGGGYHSGMPAFFVFAIVFSAFFLDGVVLWVVLPLLALELVGCIVLAYLHPEWVTPLGSEQAVMTDVAYCVLASGLALALALRLLLRIYERNRQELARLDAARSRFLAMVAHELNTPLTAIRAHAEEATQRLADTPVLARDDLGVVMSETDRLAGMVSQLLDLARIEEGIFRLDRRPEPLNAIVQEVLHGYRPLWTQNGNTVRVTRDGPSPIVDVDRERVTQVLVNLLSNASRHTTDGTITITIRLDGGFAELGVADTGEGIEPERLAALDAGARPARPVGVRSARDTGLGVGLTITRHIVTEHGGRMTIESRPGEGTTVRCTFPLAAAPAAVGQA